MARGYEGDWLGRGREREKIGQKDECLHIRAGCIRTRAVLENARCILKSALQRNFLLSPEETENARRHVVRVRSYIRACKRSDFFQEKLSSRNARK